MNKILWFRFDLRLHDNEAVKKAIIDGKTLPIFIFDEEYYKLETSSTFHLQFCIDSIEDLEKKFKEEFNAKLNIYYGDTREILKYLSKKFNINEIYSTQHYKNKQLRQLDQQIQILCKENDIQWKIYNHFGVQLNNRNGQTWSKDWNNFINTKQTTIVQKAKFLHDDHLIDYSQIQTSKFDTSEIQRGGRMKALELLESFVEYRSENYQQFMSSPVTGESACSRLSPYIAFGNISLREIYQRVTANNFSLIHQKKSINAFKKRLAWHCHFIQKFYDEPKIEFENMNAAYNGIRENSFNEKYYEAWKSGMTGYPFIDACMRYLQHKGWINFRMRAMLVSFASYQLWLDWRITSKYLAQLFTDYEPGIHYSQFQMQSGTTGINTIRMYNPIKQSYDQDPEGIFIKKWVPELSEVPESLVHEPWKLTYLEQQSYNFEAGKHYPLPIVDNALSTKNARDKIWKIKSSPVSKILSKNILKKHTSAMTNFS